MQAASDPAAGSTPTRHNVFDHFLTGGT